MNVQVEKDDSEDEEQGLNIDAAKQRMRDQDKLDKEEQRKRIREMHRVGSLTAISCIVISSLQ